MAEDSDNALLPRGGSLPTPVLVDPLNALNRGLLTAHGMWEVQGARAKEAAGQAYQGAINPQTGEFDANEFRRRLAASGPAAMEAGTALANTQNISSNQLEQSIKKANWANSAAGSLTRLGPNITEQHALDVLQQGVTSGILTPAEFQRQSAEVRSLGGDPAKLNAWANQHQFTAMSVEQQLKETYGSREPVQAGDATYHPVIPPARAGGTVVTQHGPPAGSTTSSSEPYDDQGIIPRDTNGAPTRPPKGYTTVTKPVTAVPGIAGSTPPAVMPGSGTGGPPAIPAPPAGMKVTPPLPGAYQPRTAGGATPVPTPAPAPGATAPAPAATPPQTPVAPAPVTPAPSAKPPVFTAPPQGQPEKLKADVEAYTQDQAAVPAIATRAQNMGHAYEALKLLQSATGKGAAGINEIRSRLQTLGMLPAGSVNEQAVMEIFTKYTERAMIDAAGGSSTDMGKRMAEQSSPGNVLSTRANFEFLRNDMGKTLQGLAAYKAAPDTTGNGYLAHRADLADKTDPRGFVWNLYTPAEQAKINKEVEGNQTAAEKLHRAIGMAGRLSLQIPGVSGAPAPQKQSFVAPPAPMQNAFTMTG
jgi:hypothetical protein